IGQLCASPYALNGFWIGGRQRLTDDWLVLADVLVPVGEQHQLASYFVCGRALINAQDGYTMLVNGFGGVAPRPLGVTSHVMPYAEGDRPGSRVLGHAGDDQDWLAADQAAQ